jgi:prepilin-type N-terminal cleavage/methylation domain-containing protein
MTPSRANSRRRGFSLLEVLMTMTIIAMVAVIILPEVSDDARLRIMAASAILTSDIEYAQVCTITYPDDPVVVRFDNDGLTYWLAPAATPDVPIAREDTGEPYLVTLGGGRAASADGASFEVTDLAADTITFNAYGGLEDFDSSPSIDLKCGDVTVTLLIAPTTGTVTETDG